MSPIVALVLGCSGSPASIDYVEQVTLYDQREVRPDATVRDGRGRLLPGSSAAPIESADPSIVTLTEEGFACRGSGVTEVTLQAEELLQTVEVVCQLVGRIEVKPTEIEVVLDLVESVLEPVELEALVVRVYDESDQLVDLPVQVRTSNSDLVALGPDDVLEIQSPGRVTLSVHAGDKSVEVPVLIGEVVSSEAVAVAEASVSRVPVRPGSWRWSVRSDDLVELSVVGCDHESTVGDMLEDGCEMPGGASSC